MCLWMIKSLNWLLMMNNCAKRLLIKPVLKLISQIEQIICGITWQINLRNILIKLNYFFKINLYR